MSGERLSQLVSLEGLKLAAGVLLLSPFIPLLFMGEEYGETAPFLYFTSFLDEGMVAALRQGRRQEFAAFLAEGEPPDPQAEETFQRCRLNHGLKTREPHRTLLAFHRELLRLRREVPALAHLSQRHLEVQGFEREHVLWLRRWYEQEEVLGLFHFGSASREMTVPWPVGPWRKLVDSAEERWLGPGAIMPETLTSAGEVSLTLSPQALLVFARERG
jgi:maltooligosyltrehalose trehalohydrolase